jgi:hypothetical protein
MDDIEMVPHAQFISLEDACGHVYGFSLLSLAELHRTAQRSRPGRARPRNPYNRQSFLPGTRGKVKRLLRLLLVLGHDMSAVIKGAEQPPAPLSNEPRTRALFTDMEEHGMFVSPEWLLDLEHGGVVRLMRELSDIWNYRAHHLTGVQKRAICPPDGDPFRGLDTTGLAQRGAAATVALALTAMERLTRHGLTQADRALGVSYAMCALVLVSPPAAIAYPWLFEAVGPGWDENQA